jgi:sodium/hydrogen exchanger-like protein 6/7
MNEEQDAIHALALTLFAAGLLLTLWITSTCQAYKLTLCPHESIIALSLGSVIALLPTWGIHSAPSFHQALLQKLTLSRTLLNDLLLPVILTHAAYDLKDVKRIATRLGDVIALAFLGTFFSVLTVGICMLTVTQILPLGVRLSWREAGIFGAAISPTDPVTVLAVFAQYGVDARLVALLVGESLFNDATAVSLFHILNGNPLTTSFSISALIFSCIQISLGSILVGLVCAGTAMIGVRFSPLRNSTSASIGFVLICGVMASPVARALHTSGLVSLVVSGLALRWYTRPYLSSSQKRLMDVQFHTLARLAELALFIGLGTTVVARLCLGEATFHWGLLVLCIGMIGLGRAMAVFPVCKFLNWISSNQTSKAIPWNHQLMLWFAGLRGGVSYALILDTQASPEIIKTMSDMVLTLVVLSIVLGGGCVTKAMSFCNIKTQRILDSVILDPASETESDHDEQTGLQSGPQGAHGRDTSIMHWPRIVPAESMPLVGNPANATATDNVPRRRSPGRTHVRRTSSVMGTEDEYLQQMDSAEPETFGQWILHQIRRPFTSSNS